MPPPLMPGNYYGMTCMACFQVSKVELANFMNIPHRKARLATIPRHHRHRPSMATLSLR